MRARKGRSAEATAVERRPPEEGEDDFGETEAIEEGATEKETGFFACYLLASLSPRHKARTYIGFTVNPRRRIRQHNGEITSGAWRTKNGRPWEMVLCIYGFPSNVSALQFEWAWQHPRESLAVRKAASSFKSLSGIANKIKISYTMLLLPAWENLNLTVNFFSTKYMKHTAGCPKLPKQMKTILCIMDELPCYVKGSIFDDSIEEVEDADDDNNEKEGSISPCLDVPVDHMEKDANHVQTTARHGLDIWSKYDDFLMELESSPRYMESSKATKDSAVDEVGVTSYTDELNIWGDFSGIRKPIETAEFCCLIDLPKLGQEDSSTSTGTTQVSCSEDAFDFLTENSLESSKQQWTPRSSNKKASTDSLLLSPENNVINLVSPPSFLVGSCKNNKHKKTPVHMDVIDLTDSPISL